MILVAKYTTMDDQGAALLNTANRQIAFEGAEHPIAQDIGVVVGAYNDPLAKAVGQGVGQGVAPVLVKGGSYAWNAGANLLGRIGLSGGDDASAAGFASQMSAEEATRYNAYWDGLGGRAPVQSTPYNIIPKFDAQGNIAGATTYDLGGNRAYQYEISSSARHGEVTCPRFLYHSL